MSKPSWLKWPNWLIALINAVPKSTNNCLSEDMRKIGTAIVSVGLIGLVVSGDKITTIEALTIVMLGLTLVILGISLHSIVINGGDAQ